MMILFAAVHMSAFGTKRTFQVKLPLRGYPILIESSQR
jgi:hypothetical protein